MTLVVLALMVMGSAWILGAPRSAGPDEPGHNVRAAELVRGQLEGVGMSGVNPRGFDLPAHIGFPPPDCYAFEPFTPASCAADLEVAAGRAILGTRAANYPVWGHLPAGVGTFAPASIAPWAARAADALLPLLLLAGSVIVAARRGALGVGVTMLAMTPMAWFMFATVNPNGLTIAGGLAVWTGLSGLVPVGVRLSKIPPDRTASWLAAIGWAALVLPRRDGLVWGSLILALAILTMPVGARTLARRIGRWPLAVATVSTLATLVWAMFSNTNDARALFLTPLAPLATIVGRRLWRRLPDQPKTARWVMCGVGGLVGLVAMIAVMGTRSNGFDRSVLRLVIGETGENLRQAIGVMGWLDTPVPTSVMFVCVLAIGALGGVAVVVGDRHVGIGMSAILAVGVLVSWTLTMLQDNEFGVYWQGRYYLPLLVGIPVLGARLRLDPAAARRLGLAVLVAGLAIANVGLAAMMRRFAGGISGTLLPWEWDTYGTPAPPVVLLAIHVMASAAIVWWATTLAGRSAVIGVAA